MTELQRARNRKLAAERKAKFEAEIERFKKTAPPPISYSDDYNDITEYRDPRMQGLSFRIFIYKLNPPEKPPRLYTGWFFKRPGKRALELNLFDDATPRQAREAVGWLLTGDEGAILGTYLKNAVGIDDHNCCLHESDTLQEKTLAELECEVERKRSYLDWVIKKEGRSAMSRYACRLRPMRCRLRQLEAMLKRYAKFREREGLEIKIKTKPQKQAA